MSKPFSWCLLLLVTVSASVGCAAQKNEPGLFGGQGAQIGAANEKPLPEGAGDPAALGPCGKMSPASDAALIDDFEDGDGHMFKAFERDGYWFGANDKTQGSTQTPSGNFMAEKLPEAEGNKDNRYAAHLTAAGQKDWVTWGTEMKWTRDGLRCPLNVSGFAGVRFRAKGPGRVRVTLAVPEVTPKEGGGTCSDRCYDAHGKWFELSPNWDSYELRWEKLQQGGWGTEARFTPERIVNIHLSPDVKTLPIDFWVDDIELIPKTPATTAAAR